MTVSKKPSKPRNVRYWQERYEKAQAKLDKIEDLLGHPGTTYGDIHNVIRSDQAWCPSCGSPLKFVERCPDPWHTPEVARG